MAVKLKIPRQALLVRLLLHPFGKILLASVAITAVLALSCFTYYYVKYARLIEAKLEAGPFSNTSMVFAAPQQVMVGEDLGAADVSEYLRRCGYGESRTNRMGWYNLRPDGIEIYPGPDAYDHEPAVLKFSGGRLAQIISLRDNTERTEYLLEPELITNLFDRKREKRRLVRFADVPKVMVDAVLAAEDKRFFQHAGFDPIRILRAAWTDVWDRHQLQGASTLTQQLARSLWLGPERGWRRKIPELMMTLHLEQKLSKEKIFEYYANTIYLGNQGSFGIHGFGEGAQVYFGKDLGQVTLPEAALLAGLIQSPNLRNPFRYPERAKARRNWVLKQMLDDGFIIEKEYDDGIVAPLHVTKEEGESSDAPYFVDLVNDFLQSKFQDYDFQNNSFRVYTTLDMNLERDAAEAIRVGLQEVDPLLKRRFKGYGTTVPEAQVALVALDPDTGEIKALVGGRNYGQSQLDRAVAKRQPGSAFKPFVYAAAMNTALTESSHALTPISTVVDEPTTFWYDNKPYEPSNFKNEYFGTVTLRYAMAHSLNVATVKVAEQVGFDKVVDLARAAGMNLDIKPTPAVALGAYEVTPIEVAGAYTIFADHGEYVRPNYVLQIRDREGHSIYDDRPERRQVLDPRVAYLMVDMLEEVMRSGTAAGVRARGFTLPAAGKTGTSHDGWFAGFTSKLICVVWLGFDDNRDFKLEGAKTALPIWTEFMKRAHRHREYRNVSPFEAPDGIVSVDIDPASGQLATVNCPDRRTDVFIAGTQPVDLCRLHGGGRTQIAGWEPVEQQPQAGSETRPASPGASRNPQRVSVIQVQPTPPQQPKKPPHKGFFSRIRDWFK